MAKILVLEDSPERQFKFRHNLDGHSVTITAYAQACIYELMYKEWDWLFLDHDLGGDIMVESGINTGYEVAQFLAAHPDMQPPRIIIHSLNPVGAKNMKAVLPKAEEFPFVWLKLRALLPYVA